MCQLLGLSFNRPVTASFSFRGFQHRSQSNPHGWGIGTFLNGKAGIIKEPKAALKSLKFQSERKSNRLKSNIYIAHVRLASHGTISLKNTHPFQFTHAGTDYVFAHNGTLRDYEEGVKSKYFVPQGETDSEVAFAYLMEQIAEQKITQLTENDFKWMHSVLKEINLYGDFNCLFSDGTYLFCYYDEKGYTGLCFTHRRVPFGTVSLTDEDWVVNLKEEKDPDQEGYVIATKPITDEKWIEFNPGQLMVFHDGKMIYN